MVPHRHPGGAGCNPRTTVVASHRALAPNEVSRMRRNLYTITPDRPFLATLANGLIGMTAADPLILPRITVLLPTRRAVRSLREAFLRATAEGRSLLLPRMRAIGDLDWEELPLA